MASFFKNIIKILSPDQDFPLYEAYFVGDADLADTIQITGIPVCSDGFVHLFGNLSCAVTKRNVLEALGIKCSIWKVDISECGKAEIDAKEEITLIPHVAGTHDEYCHGFLVKRSISGCKILSNVNYC